ncbi:MAG: glutaredoxin family protein [Betaproteobacteria bacterium]
METETTPALTVYSRRGCHLCEDMIVQLQALQSFHGFTFTVVDVDADGSLVRRYGDQVPVLAHADRELCRHRFDVAAVTAFLTDFR